ncbi:hypothetical protein LY76DRAFT_598716 [Colletotrichum caudatum]|nr:hypothetical protein LY76DRAFT_598716 [Colletotrichum caudatum]
MQPSFISAYWVGATRVLPNLPLSPTPPFLIALRVALSGKGRKRKKKKDHLPRRGGGEEKKSQKRTGKGRTCRGGVKPDVASAPSGWEY